MKKYTKKNYKKSEKSNKYRKSRKSKNSKNPKKSNKSRKSKNPKKSRKIFYLKGGTKKDDVKKFKREIDESNRLRIMIIKEIEKYKATNYDNKEKQAENIAYLEGQLNYYTGLLKQKEYLYNTLKKELEEEEKANEERRRQIADAVAKAKEERARVDEISQDVKVRQDLRLDAARAKIESSQAAEIQQKRLDKLATVDEITELEEDIRKSKEHIEEGEKQLEEIKKKISNVTTPPNELEDFRNLENTLERYIIGKKLDHRNLLVKYNTLKLKKEEIDKKLKQRKAKQDKAKVIPNPDADAQARAKRNEDELLALLSAEEEAGKTKAAADKAKADKAAADKAKAAADKAKAAADKAKAAADKAKAAADKAKADKAAADAAKREAAAADAAKREAAAAQEEEDLQNALALSLQDVSDKTQLAAQSSSGHLELEENLIAGMQEEFQNFLMFQLQRLSQSDKNEEYLASLATQMQVEFDNFIQSQYEILSQHVAVDDLQENIIKMRMEFAEFLENNIGKDALLKQPSGVKVPPKKSSLNRNAKEFTPHTSSFTPEPTIIPPGMVPFSEIISYTNPFHPLNPNNPYTSYYPEIEKLTEEELKQRVIENEKRTKEEQERRIESARTSGEFHYSDK